MKRQLTAALAATVILLAGLAVSSGGAAALAAQRLAAGPARPGGTWGVPHVMGLPADGESHSGALRSMSCTAPGECTAVGFYADQGVRRGGPDPQ